jgi:hypothetical protein
VGETLVRRALDEIVAVVAPDRGPLPRTVPASMVEPESAGTADATDPADTDTDTEAQAAAESGTRDDAADAARG